MEKETKKKRNTTKNSSAAKKSTTKRGATKKKESNSKGAKPEVKETNKITKTKKESNIVLEFVNKYFKDDKQALIFGGIIIAVAILAASIGFAIAQKPIPTLEDGTQILAEIDGTVITADDLYSTMKERAGFAMLLEEIDSIIVRSKVEESEEVIAYADSQVEQLKMQLDQQGQDFDTLLRSWGFESEAELYDYFKQERMRTDLVNSYIKDNLTESEMKAYYNNDVDGEMTVRHILIQPDYDGAETNEAFEAADAQAIEKANEIIEMLNDGADFEELAIEYSDDEGTAANGGLFSGFNKNEVVPEFWEASINLEDGEYSQEPVRSQFGYHVILRIEQGEKPEYEDVIDMIKDELLEEKRQAVENLEEKTMLEIREEFNIVINDRDILRQYEDFKKQINQ